jgi:hypothetical protein
MIEELGQRETIPKIHRHPELLFDVRVVMVAARAAEDIGDFT